MAKLVQMQLKNCQSWAEDSGVIKFSPHINCIKAPNNVGKSVIMKMLSASLGKLNKQELRSLIRHGEEFAAVYYMFDDFSVVVVRVYPNQVLYFYSNNINEEPIKSNGRDIPQVLINNLSILAGETSNFIVNLIDDERPLFLVSSDHNYNYELLTILSEHQELNRVVELAKEKQGEMFYHLRDIREKKRVLEYKIEKLEYVDTTEMENKINFGEMALPIFDMLLSLGESIENISPTKAMQVPVETCLKASEVFGLTEELEGISYKYINEIPHLAELNELYKLSSEVEEIKVPETLLKFHEVFSELNDSKMELDLIEETLSEVLLRNSESLIELYTLNEEVKPSNYSTLAKLINPLAELEELRTEMVDYLNARIRYSKLKKEEHRLEELKLSEGEYECPIYGKVSYKDNLCKPIVERGTNNV